jgi:hypothetical protein
MFGLILIIVMLGDTTYYEKEYNDILFLKKLDLKTKNGLFFGDSSNHIYFFKIVFMTC